MPGGEIMLTTAFKPGFRLSVPGNPSKVTLPLEFCVRDNGGGVPEDLIPHLFEPFVTARNSTKLGLSLALARELLRAIGGELTAGNRPDLVEKETSELQVLEGYLPKRLSADEVAAEVAAVVAELGASGPGDMGKVMGAVKAKLAGKADMGMVSAAVKKALAP